MNLQPVTHFFSGVPVDWLLLAVALIVVTFFTMMRGASYATALALSLPASLLVFESVGTSTFFGGIARGFSTPFAQGILFLIIAALLFVLANQALASFDSSAPPLQAIIVAVCTIAIFLVIWIQVPALQGIWHFSAKTQSIFGDTYRFWWLIGSYAALAFARR